MPTSSNAMMAVFQTEKYKEINIEKQTNFLSDIKNKEIEKL